MTIALEIVRWCVIVLICAITIEGKVYDRCELAQELRFRFDVVSEEEIAIWVCIAQYQSSFNTAAIGPGGYYGLFQIGEEFWCDKQRGAGKGCNVPCDRLIDDNISDDFACNKVIFEEHQRLSGDGFKAWANYESRCSAGKARSYIDGCFDNFITRGPSYVESNLIRKAPNDAPTRIKLPIKPHKQTYKAVKGRSRIYQPCELAQELVYQHDIPMEQVATWVCIAKHESNFNTSAVGMLNADGSGDHGLFQISDIYWCSPPGKGWVCGLSCAKLEDDDITDDVQCMKKIYEEHQRLSGDGFNAWAVYPRCKGQSEQYTRNCFDDSENEILPRPGVIAPVKPPSRIQKPYKDYTEKMKAKVYDRCELAQELVYQHNIAIEQVATWVCIAQHESNFNTSAVGRLNADGSEDHGLFQISDIYWCSPPGTGRVCGLSCARLEDDDITDDVNCMKKIYEEHQGLSGDGFNAWTVYGPHCKGNVDNYVKGCFKEDENFVIPSSHRPTIATTTEIYDNTIDKTHAKVYGRCELANELVYKHDIPMDQVATWVCIAQHESNFNTSAVGRLNADGSEDHGLFQISDIYWCSPPGKGWVCGLSCAKLEDDDITDDVNCMKKIYEEHQGLSGDGFNAWTVYPRHCQGKSEKYIQGCFQQTPIISVVKPTNDDSLSLIQITDRPSGHLTQTQILSTIKDKPVLPGNYRPIVQINKQPPVIAPSLVVEDIEKIITQTPDPVKQNVLITAKPPIFSIFDKRPEYQNQGTYQTTRPQINQQSHYQQQDDYYVANRPSVNQRPQNNKFEYTGPSIQSTIRPSAFDNKFESVWNALKPGSQQVNLIRPVARPQDRPIEPVKGFNIIPSGGNGEIPLAPGGKPIENQFYQTFVEPTERPATLRPGGLPYQGSTTVRPPSDYPTQRPTVRPTVLSPVKPQIGNNYNVYQRPTVRPSFTTTARPQYEQQDIYRKPQQVYSPRPQFGSDSVYERPTVRPPVSSFGSVGLTQKPTVRPSVALGHQYESHGVYEGPTVRPPVSSGPQIGGFGVYQKPTTKPPTYIRPEYESHNIYERPTVWPVTSSPQYDAHILYQKPTVRPSVFTTTKPHYEAHTVYERPATRPTSTIRPVYGSQVYDQDYTGIHGSGIRPSTTLRPVIGGQSYYQSHQFQDVYQRPTVRPTYAPITTLRPQYQTTYRVPKVRPTTGPPTTPRPQFADIYHRPTTRPPFHYQETVRPSYQEYEVDRRPTVRPTVRPPVYSTTPRPVQPIYQSQPFKYDKEPQTPYRPLTTTTYRPAFAEYQRQDIHRIDQVRDQSKPFNIFDFYLSKYKNLNTYHTTARPYNYASDNVNYVETTTRRPYVNQERYTQRPYYQTNSTPNDPFAVFGNRQSFVTSTVRPAQNFYSTTTVRPLPNRVQPVGVEHTTLKPPNQIQYQTSRPSPYRPVSSQVTVKPFSYDYVQTITKRPEGVAVFSHSPQINKFLTTVRPIPKQTSTRLLSESPRNSFDTIFERLQDRSSLPKKT